MIFDPLPYLTSHYPLDERTDKTVPSASVNSTSQPVALLPPRSTFSVRLRPSVGEVGERVACCVIAERSHVRTRRFFRKIFFSQIKSFWGSGVDGEKRWHCRRLVSKGVGCYVNVSFFILTFRRGDFLLFGGSV